MGSVMSLSCPHKGGCMQSQVPHSVPGQRRIVGELCSFPSAACVGVFEREKEEGEKRS